MVAELAGELRCRVDLVIVDAIPPALRGTVHREALLLDRTPLDSSSTNVPPAHARTLYQHRLLAVRAALRESKARTVVDLGCGRGWLVELLARDGELTRIMGVDMDDDALRAASARMHASLTRMQRRRITHALITYRHPTLLGHDAAVAIEVVEHLDPPQRAALEHVLFGYAQPSTVIVTTPNVEYNVHWRRQRANKLRDDDHRFEWTRQQFGAWSDRLAKKHRCDLTIKPVGPADDIGAPTQMAIFRSNHA